MKIMLLAMMLFILPCVSFASSLPLNTGYDYSNNNVYPNTIPDDYWIRIASYTPVTPNVGPSWTIATFGGWAAAMNGPTGIPSKWINAFGNTAASATGINTGNPGYAIYRKCFCLQGQYGQSSIQGSARSDDTIEIWLNSHLNTVLATSPGRFQSSLTPHNLNYTNQSGFKSGRNCIYVLVEDAGTVTGLDIAANIVTAGTVPIIPAKGPNMSFEPCSCGGGGPVTTVETGGVKKSSLRLAAEPDDQTVVNEIIKMAEARRLEKTRLNQPKK